MNVVLIFPPLAPPTQPYSSLPALTGFLRARGHHQVTQLDANIEFTREILTGRSVRIAAERIADRISRVESDGGESGSATEIEVLSSAALKAPIVATLVDQAVLDLKDRETFVDLERLNRAKRIVHDAFEVVSAAWYPVCLSGLDRIRSVDYSWSELDRRARDPEGNPFRSFLEQRLIPRLLRARPGAIGISITYESQLLATATLCLILKRLLPEVPIVLGGQIVSSWYERLDEFSGVFEWCDFLVSYEGETALEALLSAMQSGHLFDQVPNLVYLRGRQVVKHSCLAEEIDDLPTPDYNGLPLHLYLAPDIVFLLSTSRGCYWSKCNFCSVSPSMRHRHRARSDELVLRDIETLITRHGLRCLMFGDDCVPPRLLRTLPSLLSRLPCPISWQCEVRFESALTGELLRNLARSGCRNLAFGLESYASRVLLMMNKGVRRREIRRILDDCRRSGIAFNLQLFFGFPGETALEAAETSDFVLDQMRGAATCSFGLFRLLRGSNIQRNPEQFRVRLLEPGVGVLSERIDYEPLPQHAEETRQELRRRLLTRLCFPHVAFSLDAHTLLFLDEAGFGKMVHDYYMPQESAADTDLSPARSARRHLVRKGNQVIGDLPKPADGGPVLKRIVVYDYDLDRAVEVSELAVWVLRQFDTPKMASEAGLQAAGAALDPGQASRLRSTVDEIVAGLFDRGLLVESDAVAPLASGRSSNSLISKES